MTPTLPGSFQQKSHFGSGWSSKECDGPYTTCRSNGAGRFVTWIRPIESAQRTLGSCKCCRRGGVSPSFSVQARIGLCKTQRYCRAYGKPNDSGLPQGCDVFQKALIRIRSLFYYKGYIVVELFLIFPCQIHRGNHNNGNGAGFR